MKMFVLFFSNPNFSNKIYIYNLTNFINILISQLLNFEFINNVLSIKKKGY